MGNVIYDSEGNAVGPRNPLRMTESVDIRNRQAMLLPISGAVAQTDMLAGGIYDIVSDIDCYLSVGDNPGGVTTANGYKLMAGNVVPFVVGDQQHISAVATASGTLRIQQVA